MEQALEGKCPGEHRRGDFALARAWGRKRTDSRGEQSFEAGVPAANRRARREGEGQVYDHVKAWSRDRPSDRGKTSSRLMRLGSPPGGLQAKSWRDAESDREVLDHAALAVVGCEPARKQGPARAGTAPREGKALEGSSKGTRAACNKAAKRRGATA